jgi:methylenetetrahydrofolate dehydrogenase (NADP+)/methenyltetrahydrofolate cyclohydrolase
MDGRIVSKGIVERVKNRVKVLRQIRVEPNLVTILVGNNAASRTYLKNKHAACMEAGIKSRNLELSAGTSQGDLEQIIRGLNDDRVVTGILLQLPLPKGLEDAPALAAIDPEKDVDGLTPHNLGLLLQKSAKLVPCTPKGVVALLSYYGVKTAGQHAVIINRSKLVGRPLAQLLLNQDATVTVCHSKTQDLGVICRQADILITGIGRRSEFVVGADMIKPGAAVVDVGTSSVGGKLIGDVDFVSAVNIAAYVSPVPGGVGPMTIAMLLYNTLLAACLQSNMEIGFDSNEFGPSDRI